MLREQHYEHYETTFSVKNKSLLASLAHIRATTAHACVTCLCIWVTYV